MIVSERALLVVRCTSQDVALQVIWNRHSRAKARAKPWPNSPVTTKDVIVVWFVASVVSRGGLAGEAPKQPTEWEPDCGGAANQRCYLPTGAFRTPSASDGGKFGGAVADDAWLRNIVTRKLHAVDEPLLRASVGKVVLRCAAFPTWDASRVVRLERSGGDAGTRWLVVKKHHGETAGATLQVVTETRDDIKETSIREFVRSVRAAAVATVPDIIFAVDGDLYAAEVVIDGNYLAVGELVFGGSGPGGVGVRAACQELFRAIVEDFK